MENIDIEAENEMIVNVVQPTLRDFYKTFWCGSDSTTSVRLTLHDSPGNRYEIHNNRRTFEINLVEVGSTDLKMTIIEHLVIIHLKIL